MEIKVLERQSLFDIAVQHTGCVETCFAIAFENKLSITGEYQPTEAPEGIGKKQHLHAGMLLSLPQWGVEGNKVVSDYFRTGGWEPATGYPETESLLPDGIDYMAVEYDNIVR